MVFASTTVTFAAPPSSFFRSHLQSCLPPPPSSPSSLPSLLASPLTPVSATIVNPCPLFYVSLLSQLPSNTRNPSTFPVLAHHCSHRRHPPSSPRKAAISISFTDAIALLSGDVHHGLPCFSLFIFSFVSAFILPLRSPRLSVTVTPLAPSSPCRRRLPSSFLPSFPRPSSAASMPPSPQTAAARTAIADRHAEWLPPPWPPPFPSSLPRPRFVADYFLQVRRRPSSLPLSCHPPSLLPPPSLPFLFPVVVSPPPLLTTVATSLPSIIVVLRWCRPPLRR